jgi:hypothetical protein
MTDLTDTEEILEGPPPLEAGEILARKDTGQRGLWWGQGFRQWIKERPGFVGSYHVQDSKVGRMLSITIWDAEECMEALRERTPPGVSLGITTDREELFDVVEEY